ncbi:MAG: DUF11 domain-containing protein [Chloroflexi bacterium]|nr:DUF11 domain-containing protein [Chloroflexota bacterium]
MALFRNRSFILIAGLGILSIFLSMGAQTAVFGAPPAQTVQIDSIITPHMVNNVLISDGSFEETPSAWRERDNTRCLPWIGDWSNIPNFPTAYDGNNYFWAGGKCGPVGNQVDNSNSTQQNITLQPIDTTLSFWYNAYRTDTDSAITDDYAYVKINNVEVWRLDMTQANNSNGWIQITLDINAYSGQSILLKLGGVNGNFAGAGNLFFDYIEVGHDATVTPSVQISKTPDNQTINLGETAVFTIDVTNDGNVTLYQVNVTDPNSPGCDLFIGQLDVAQTETYSCQKLNVNESFTNTAEVTAQDVNGIQVSDTDSADVNTLNPDITIFITPETQTISSGSNADFEITITNNGNVDLFNISVDAPKVSDCIQTIDQLNVGVSHSYNCTEPSITLSFLNIVTVTANDQLNNIVSANDDAFVDVIDSDIVIAINPDTQTVVSGNVAKFNVFVFNIGDVDLTNVQLFSEQVPDCNRTFNELAADNNTSFTCESSSVTEPFVNTVTATAFNPIANIEVSDSDIAFVDMLSLVIIINATPTSFESPGGGTAVTVNLTNIGNKSLTLTNITGTLFKTNTDQENSPLLNNSCTLDQIIIANGGTFDCAFDVEIFESTGEYDLEIEVTATDNNQIEVTGKAQTPITITPPQISNLYIPLLLNNYIFGEPNDICTEPFDIAVNTPYNFLADDINDWYYFELDSPANLTATLTNFAPIYGQISIWYGPCNAPVFLGHNGDFSTTKTVTLGLQPAGEYRVWVINDGSTTTNLLYTLQIMVTP